MGNNTPVFFVRDPLKLPDFIHTQKRDPKTNLRSNTAMWDLWSLTPESLHQVMILMSDRGIPRNMRQQHGFGSHTYSFYNAGDKRVWVKFHMISQQGIANYTNEEAEQIAVSYTHLDVYKRQGPGVRIPPSPLKIKELAKTDSFLFVAN